MEDQFKELGADVFQYDGHSLTQEGDEAAIGGYVHFDKHDEALSEILRLNDLLCQCDPTG